jgi:hypothetical protein
VGVGVVRRVIRLRSRLGDGTLWPSTRQGRGKLAWYERWIYSLGLYGPEGYSVAREEDRGILWKRRSAMLPCSLMEVRAQQYAALAENKNSAKARRSNGTALWWLGGAVLNVLKSIC